MKIGIEASTAVEAKKAGVGQYSYHLIRSLIGQTERNHHYTCYFRHASPAPLQALGLQDDVSAQLTIKVMSFPYLWAQMRLPFEFRQHPQDVYFFPSSVVPLVNQPEKSVVTVHDLAFLFFQECFSPGLRNWLKIATERSVKKAQKVIAVSEATCQDILAYYQVDPEKVIVIHHGVDERFTPQAAEAVDTVKQRYHIDGDYLLCVGTLQRRKNISRLLQAFYLLKQKHQHPQKLVLVGQKYADLPEDDIFSTMKRLSLEQDVIWTGYIEHEEMPAIMSGAEVFVLPSLYEGFGMPVLEAMACGTPVACSNTSSLPEVSGDNRVVFDPYSVDDMAETLHHLLLKQELRQELSEQGRVRAAHFSWESCARKTLDVLESVGQKS
ncbi:MAG: glycosyltransferase family 4 protein [bacterium]|nr:glycosyltransferase family 4 protein [bacterium]